MTKLSHNDTPAITDQFQQETFIYHLCDVVIDCIPPKGIGINGYWGTGKTTVLTSIYHQFSGRLPQGDHDFCETKYYNEKVIPIWFEAWRYQHDDLPIIALLNEIRSQISTWKQFKNEAEKLTEFALQGALSAFDEVIKAASGSLAFFAPKIGNMRSQSAQWNTQHYSHPLPSQTIYKLLEKAIEQVIGKGFRLVILIDDLDRCRPEVALKLMEGIKVFLNLPNCVTVFGMDQRQVERALRQALKLGKESHEYTHQAQEYLEKICQDIYHIPVPDKKAKIHYFIVLLSELLEEGSSHLQLLKEVLKIYDCLPANPRKIKALVNRIKVILKCDYWNSPTMSERMLSVEGIPIRFDYSLLIALSIIHCFHRCVYEQLDKNPEYIRTVIEYAEAEGDINAKKYEPMRGILPSVSERIDLPRNPSDSNVFRLHKLFSDIETVTVDEIEPFLRGGI